MRHLTLWLICLCLLITCPVLAAGLDEDAIRALYKAQADSIKDTQKTVDLMEDQLADEYIITQKVTFDFANGQPRTSTETISKTQLIDATTMSAQTEKVDKYQNNVTDIKYSADKSFAYVNNSTTETKTIQIPGPNGQSMEVHATQGAACLDTLGLIAGAIKFVKSQCVQKVMVAK